MAKEIAAFDLDDVLFLHAQGVCEGASRILGLTATVEEYREPWESMFGLSAEDCEAFRRELMGERFFEGLEPVPGMREALTEISKRDILAVGVTKRRESLREVTRAAVDMHYPGLMPHIFHATYFEDGQKIVLPKSQLCHQARASSLVDDQGATCTEVAATGIIGVHYGDYGWEELSQPHSNIVRIRTPEELVKFYATRD